MHVEKRLKISGKWGAPQLAFVVLKSVCKPMRTAIFFERDGILNDCRVERGQQLTPRALEEFCVNGAAGESLQKLKDAGFLLLAITNQPGISRGYLSRRELDLMHVVLRKKLPVDEVLMCTHDEMDHCPCRKPRPGLIREAAFKYQLDLDRCFVVSDKWQDAQAAHNAGCTSILLDSPWIGKGHHDFVLPNLNAIAEKILWLAANPLALAS
jgi:D-glycero-D-manno-heptose 1,7-bisphosphate phosphatase